ncbi:MAG: hypothetical protein P9M03_02650 [Candidatus Theseobacter exili]|nr:hypothetical protein [Candidatus Theseobacter exili]
MRNLPIRSQHVMLSTASIVCIVSTDYTKPTRGKGVGGAQGTDDDDYDA